MNHPHSPRGLLTIIAVMGAALLACGYGLLTLKHTVDANQTTIKQLAATVASEQQAASEQLRLVQALQNQVRSLGGEPLTAPPMPRSHPRTPAPSMGPVASRAPSPAPARSTRPTPRPTRTPAPSPTPSRSSTATPSPSICPVVNICLPRPGG